MNIESLKIKFLEFLERQDNEKASEFLKSGSNIFLFSNYFKDFAKEENLTDVDLSKMSVGEIMDMQLKTEDSSDDGEYIPENYEAGEIAEEETTTEEAPSVPANQNSDGDISVEIVEGDNTEDSVPSILPEGNEEEANTEDNTAVEPDTAGDTAEVPVIEAEETESENQAATVTPEITNETVAADGVISETEDANSASEVSGKPDIDTILDKIYNNEAAAEIIDLNSDGKISKKEKRIFEKFVQGDKDELTAEDLEKALKDIEDGNFEYNPELNNKNTKNNKDSEETENSQREEAATAERTNSGGNVSGGGGGGGISSVPSSGGISGSVPSTTPKTDSDKTDNSTEDLSNMSLDKLEQEKTDRENNLTKAREDVNNVHNGTNEQVAAAQEDYEAKKEDYEKKLKNDENISDELKEKQKTNLEDIEQKQSEINDYNIDINNKESEISDKESEISEDTSNISALESALSELKSFQSDDKEKMAEISQKISSVNAQLTAAKNQKKTHESEKDNLEKELDDLEKSLDDAEEELDKLEKERTEIEEEIEKNCSPETKEALEAFNEAKENVEATKAEELNAAQDALTEAQEGIDEVNAEINARKAEEVEKENSPNDLADVKNLYKNLDLEKEGLNYDVFNMAMEGYNKLEDKGNGLFGVFDTTQDADAERYYLIDMNKMEIVGRSKMKIGSGDMDNVQGANLDGSHATLSGFEKIGEEYYSNEMQKDAVRIDGLEEGINDNARSKGTVVHYTTGNYTWGCKGFDPVYTADGQVDYNATMEKQKKLFPTGTILFTYPTDVEEYKDLSDII